MAEAIPLVPMVMMTCGVNRKINTGNYENVDIYASITLPVAGASLSDLESLRELVANAAEQGFAMASTEVNDRVRVIKDALREGRQSSDSPA